jgi:trans-aconitate methyltransferase
MLTIARERNENCTFIQGDMRDFNLEKQVDAIIITGRSTSYLTTNEDMNETFASLFINITEGGIIVFDFIDANRFIPFINENKKIIHRAEHEGINYIRESDWEASSLDNFMVEWDAKYYTLIDGKKDLIANDFSTVRVFTLNEMQLFLYLNNFEIIKTIDRKTHAYDTYVTVATKRASKT